jgi:hypothetical protein
MTTRAKVLWMLALLVPIGALSAYSEVAFRRGWNGTTKVEADPCDLDRRLFQTVGSSSVEIKDRSIAGARLFRFHRNSEPAYSSVIGCRTSGELLQPDEVFELLPHGGGSAQELAALHAWCFHEGGLATLEVVLTEDRFVALHGARETFSPPATQRGVVSFWRADRYSSWGPEPRLYLHVIDSRIGLGGQTGGWDPKWVNQPGLLAPMLSEERERLEAFPFLAYRPHGEIAQELVASIRDDTHPELRYLGLLGLRGEAGIEQVEPLAALADHETSPLVRIGVVQTLATIPAANARPLAAAILQQERDPRARRVMEASLKD